MTLAPTLHRLRYFLADAWDAWRHSPGPNLLALVTLAATLTLGGFVVLVLANVERRVESLAADAWVQVFLAETAAGGAVEALEHELAGLAGVARVEAVTKAEALERYRAWAADLAELAAELDSNPLPASLDVWLAPGPGIEAAAARVAEVASDRPEVEEVRFDRQWIERLQGLLGLVRRGGLAAGVLVLAGVIGVVASVLRLGVYARRDEIEIMQLVGATPGFVRGPFLVAGLVQGLAAAVLALAIVEAARRAAWLAGGSSAMLDLVAAHPLPPLLALALVSAGVVAGLAGSWFAVRP